MRSHGHPISTAAASLAFSAVLLVAVFVLEIVGGFLSGSVALLSDAGHVFVDLTALSFSYFAARVAARPASDRRTFGLHRMEVVAAFVNGILVTGVAVWIVMEAAHRLRSPATEIESDTMMAVAAVGLAANLFIAWKLHGFSEKDINLRSAFLHVMGDALSSVAVLVGGLLIRWTGRPLFDPLAAFLVALVLVTGALRLLKESLHILLEGVPPGLDMNEIISAMKTVPGVQDVQDAHVWNICSHMNFLSAHLIVTEDQLADQRRIIEDVNRRLKENFRIDHSTLQIKSVAWREGAE